MDQMALALKIIVIALKIIAGGLIVTLWGYGLYVRGGYSKRNHKAGVQTLFSGDK
jgi:hypothetical protein